MKNNRIYYLCLSAFLMALAIIIPMVSIKIEIPPMSFTLGSHIAIFIAIFISPAVAVAVELGATLGFFLAGFPPVVVARAFVQIVFVVIGAYWLKKNPTLFKKMSSIILFGVVTGVLHGFFEVLACLPFYTNLNTMEVIQILVLLVGVGTLVHSLVDYFLSLVLWKALLASPSIKRVSLVKEIL